MGEKELNEINFLKKSLKKKFIESAEPMNQVDYTLENYNKLFPGGKVSTPIGEISLGKHQFEKLKAYDRKNLLGAMHQTLTDPIAVINENDNRGKAQLFSKSFKNGKEKIKVVLSAIANIKGDNISISTHRRNINNIINKIKKPADLLYEKQTSGNVGTAGTDSYSPNLAISGDTQSTDKEIPINSNIPQNVPKVK